MFNNATSDDYLDPDYHLNSGNDFLSIGNNEKAMKCYDEAIRLDSEYPPAHYYKAFACYKLGHYAQGLDAVNQAIRLDPEDFSAYALKGMLLLKEPQAGVDARECFETSFALAPNNVPNENVLTELHTEGEIQLFSDAIGEYYNVDVLGANPLEVISYVMNWDTDC
jgi:tetratricopeptide (TPR) repeat protein